MTVLYTAEHDIGSLQSVSNKVGGLLSLSVFDKVGGLLVWLCQIKKNGLYRLPISNKVGGLHSQDEWCLLQYNAYLYFEFQHDEF